MQVSFAWSGFNNAMISNVGMVLRNIYSKKFLGQLKVGKVWGRPLGLSGHRWPPAPFFFGGGGEEGQMAVGGPIGASAAAVGIRAAAAPPLPPPCWATSGCPVVQHPCLPAAALASS